MNSFQEWGRELQLLGQPRGGGGGGPLATTTRRIQLCEKRITSRQDSLGATPACWPRNTPQPTQRARILFPDGKFCHQVSKPALRREPRSRLGQPHCPSNEELKSVPLAAPLEFTASPTPVFWTQNQIYGLEHRVSYRTNFEMCREKKKWLLENIKYLLQNTTLMGKCECKWVQIKSVEFPLRYSGA